MPSRSTSPSELQAAVLSAHMFLTPQRELTCNIDKIVFWTDSKTTLQFMIISSESRRFHAYVAHRVAEIRESSDPEQWRPCPGTVNQADLASRELLPRRFMAATQRREGPEFLSQEESAWPKRILIGAVPADNVENKT